MSVKWLVEPEAFPNEPYFLGKALLDLNRTHVVCKLGHPYESYIKKISGDPVVFHGSKQFADLIRKETNWTVFWNTPQFECQYYYPRFYEHLVNQDYVMLPYGSLNHRKKWLYENLGENQSIFLKSNEFKAFNGELVNWDQWNRRISQMGLWAESETMVVVAKPVTIITEWRLVIANGQVKTLSSYKPIRGIICHEVIEYANEVLRDVKFAPDLIWILDIGETAPAQFKVLEVGPFSCCALYECDAKIIINTVEEISEIS